MYHIISFLMIKLLKWGPSPIWAKPRRKGLIYPLVLYLLGNVLEKCVMKSFILVLRLWDEWHQFLVWQKKKIFVRCVRRKIYEMARLRNFDHIFVQINVCLALDKMMICLKIPVADSTFFRQYLSDCRHHHLFKNNFFLQRNFYQSRKKA